MAKTKIENGTAHSLRSVRQWRLEYSFDRELLEKAARGLSALGKMIVALRSKNVPYAHLADDLGMNYNTMIAKGKRLTLYLVNQIKKHDNNGMPVMSKRVEALSRELVKEGYISYPANIYEFRKAMIREKYLGYLPVTRVGIESMLERGIRLTSIPIKGPERRVSKDYDFRN